MTVVSAGYCDITASPTIGYGAPIPAITTNYNGDSNFLGGAGATFTLYVNNLSRYPKLPNGAYNLAG